MRSFFNPLNGTFTHPEKGTFKQDDYVDKSRNLGDKIILPKISDTSN